MSNVIDKRAIGNWIVGVDSISFDMPIYEEIPAFCDIVGMKPREYDLTKDKDHADVYNLLWDMSVMLEDAERRSDNLELRLYKLAHPEG